MKVEMRLAYEWTCDECGRNHFESAITMELTDEEREEIYENLAEGEGIDFISYPDTVTCPNCIISYETEPPNTEEFE